MGVLLNIRGCLYFEVFFFPWKVLALANYKETIYKLNNTCYLVVLAPSEINVSFRIYHQGNRQYCSILSFTCVNAVGLENIHITSFQNHTWVSGVFLYLKTLWHFQKYACKVWIVSWTLFLWTFGYLDFFCDVPVNFLCPYFEHWLWSLILGASPPLRGSGISTAVCAPTVLSSLDCCPSLIPPSKNGTP